MMPGTLYTVGVGPGDPELITLKAARILGAAPVIAFFAKCGCEGNARRIASPHLNAAAKELRFDYPFTTELDVADTRYRTGIDAFYADCAAAIALRLDAGQDVALLCEGDPFFFGSSMYLFDCLGDTYRTEIIPGVSGMSGCWTSARLPMTHGDDVLSVLPGTLDQTALTAGLQTSNAAVIMKVGRNLPKIRAALIEAGKLERAVYVERGTMKDQRILKLAEMPDDVAPYFSIVLVPGRQGPR